MAFLICSEWLLAFDYFPYLTCFFCLLPLPTWHSIMFTGWAGSTTFGLSGQIRQPHGIFLGPGRGDHNLDLEGEHLDSIQAH